ncbi:CcdB family protein [Providencia manganoxydans]|uniref:Toxin CcdB n=1 Tax=Providencia manganoxydans TaxID=2923283 RepID=A0ABX7AD10_9GAMM|nr:CcdB family protein [Providencia manganoxydans]
MQFNLYQNRENSHSPYLLDIQSDLIDRLNTPLVIPLFDRSLVRHALPVRLNPTLLVEGRPYVLMTHQMASVPHSLLDKMVADFTDQRDDIKKAIDLLIDGF